MVGDMVGGVCHVNEVALRQAWLVLGCVTIFGQEYHLCLGRASLQGCLIE